MQADPALRASDGDREDVACRLADHMAAGRLDVAEYDERVAAAYAATTVADLQPLLRDLPIQPAAAGPSLPAHASVRPAWGSWALTTLICLTIWAATSIAAGDIEGFWPFWVFGPWGAVLLMPKVCPFRASRCA